MTTRDKSKNKTKLHYAKPKRDFKAYLKFVAVAVVILVLVEFVFWKEDRPFIQDVKEQYTIEQQEREAKEQEIIEELLPPEIIFPEDGAEYFEAPVEAEIEPEPEIEVEPAPVKKSQMKSLAGQKAKIAIVIDDVGMNIRQSRAAMNLPAAVTLAFLPYASNVADMAVQAKAKGHELIIHAPMEAMDSTINLGSMALREGMDYESFRAEFDKIAASFEGYVGVNNHMGSRLTQNPQAMAFLMNQLKKRDLYFLDSRTIAASVAADVADQYGIPNATRDVFLDHEETAEFTANALRDVERIARDQGSAIAIGHPKKITMDALRGWIPTLAGRGFELVALSEVLEEVVTPVDAPLKLDIKPFDEETLHVKQWNDQEFNDITPAAGQGHVIYE